VTPARRLVFVGALVTVVGLAVAATSPVVGTDDAGRIRSQQLAGGVIVLAGWAALGWGVHRFGRER
jgi:hypothetical protein